MTLDIAPFVTEQQRSAAQIDASVTRALGRAGVAGGSGMVAASATDPLRHALDAILAHYCSVLADRLNRTPEAHLVAFTEMLGNSPEPAVPAQAPLAFKAASGPAGAPVPVVPKFTEVAAPPAQGDTRPIVFQTAADLVVLRAELVSAVAVDFGGELAGPANAVVSEAGLPAGTTLVSHAVPLVHALSVGQRSLFGAPDLVAFALSVEVGHIGTLAPRAAMQWGIDAPDGFTVLELLRDTTDGLTKSGEIAFSAPPKWPKTSMHGSEGFWLTCRLRRTTTPAPSIAPFASAMSADGGDATASGACASATITRLAISADLAVQAGPLDAAFFGRMPLDLSRDFYPFGERPRFGDVFYLASAGFAACGARIVLHVDLTNPAGAEPDASPIQPVSLDGNPCVQWEIHTASGWRAVTAEDGTATLTHNGTLSFTVPDDAAQSVIGNVKGGWLRARLISGNYGVGRRTLENFTALTDAPPSIAKISMTMSLHVGPLAPEQVVVDDGLRRVRLDPSAAGDIAPFVPFPPYELRGRALYIGIRAIPAQFRERKLSLYVGSAQRSSRPVLLDAGPQAHAPRWQVHSTSGWLDCTCNDCTGGLMHAGFVTLDVGDDVEPWRETLFDPDPALLWLRVALDPVDAANPPTLARATPAARSIALMAPTPPAPRADWPPVSRIVLNAVPSVQTIQLDDEVLGSATGRPSQSFRTARAPVIGEVGLEVREGNEGVARDWVRWNPVDNFGQSGHESRDFVLDRLAGAVTFGDGRRGRIPAAAGNNIRITYRSGGGSRGNCPPHTIAQLRTTIPYVASVTNCDGASGGQDTLDELTPRRAALARLRHRDRAVCIDDYADLACQSSPEVARAACRGGRDFGPSSTEASSEPAQGVVSVTIVPRGEDCAPQPSLALLARARTYLLARCPAGVELVLLGPMYLPVSVEAELVVSPDASLERVTAACMARFNAFLHPVTGGMDGRGWPFGSEPHASDLLRVVDTIDGIDNLLALRLRFSEPVPGLRGRGGFLVCAGSHTISPRR